ncbi:MAG: hypothetical protein HF982_07205 [Desulfobacteraceae bacterium]|nr:hypothetical protein [Desulfobacteraceae bacterium]
MILAPVLSALAATITVPVDYPTIQEAVNAASSGDTVHVEPGVYQISQTVVLKAGITLEGSGPCDTIIEAVDIPYEPSNYGALIRTSSHTSITGFRFKNVANGAAILCCGSGYVTDIIISRNVITACLIGIYLDNPYATGEAWLINNTIVDSQNVGIHTNDWGIIHMFNNIVVGCNYGIYRYNVTTWCWEYNDVLDNFFDWYLRYQGPFQAPENNLSEDPLFKDENAGDYRLSSGSPCIDAGQPDPSYNDPDGSRNDIGALPCGACNQPPIANAGHNFAIPSEAQCETVMEGTASDSDGDALTYQWFEGETELSTVLEVGPNGEAHLDLCTVLYLDICAHTLTLKVSDGTDEHTDDMILTIDNSAPHAAPTGEGVYKIFSPVTLGGEVSDFDGDELTCEWLEGEDVLFTAVVESNPGGDPVVLPVHSVDDLSLGSHTLTLSVDDEVNEAATNDIKVEIVDTTVPTLAPVCNKMILWPPDHKMVDISIGANASDNGGGNVILSATVSSDEPVGETGDGDQSPDWTDPVINQDEGVIALQLRAERSGSKDGRIYTVSITATDVSGNSRTADVNILVPHDKRKN